MSHLKDDRLFADVEGLSTDDKDTVVPDGETWEITSFQGSGAYLDDTAVYLIWDPAGANEILDCTHGDKSSRLAVRVVGNGTKVLRLLLQNDTNDARVVGGSWTGKVVIHAPE